MDFIARTLLWNAPDLALRWAAVLESRSNYMGVRFRALDIFVRGSVILGGRFKLDPCDSLKVVGMSAISR